VSGEYHENYDGLKHLGRLFGLLAALGRPLGLGVAVPSEGLAQRHFSSLNAGEKLRCQFSNAFRPVNVAGTWRANTPEVSTRAQHQTNRAAIAQRGPLARVRWQGHKGSAGGVRFAVETTCPGEALSPTACGRRDEVQGLQVL
jgi:hypothetical protein